jgi:electron transfer flavoprotein beta subunit
MIRIIVCFKQAACLYSRAGIDPRGQIDPDSIVYIPNPYDEIAAEEALRIKERLGHVEVILICLGPRRAESALIYGLAMGADRAIHICDEKLEKTDPWMTAKALAKVIESQNFDLVLCGKKAIDDNEGIVGAFVAEFLNLPFVSSATDIALREDEKKARAYQVLERGDRQLVESCLPAVVSVEKGATTPRYPTLCGRITALRKPVLKLDWESLAINPLFEHASGTKGARVSLLRPKPKKTFIPDGSLTAEERIRLIMSGGLMEKKSNSLKGSHQEMAERFIEFLEENHLINKSGKDRGGARR